MMLCCRASPNDFNAALSVSPATLSICRTQAGTRMAARIAMTASTPIISISEKARSALQEGHKVGRDVLLAAQPEPKKLPLLHPREERAGPSPRRSGFGHAGGERRCVP